MTRNPTESLPERPVCANCGKSYGERRKTEQRFFFAPGEEVVLPPTNGIVTKTVRNDNALPPMERRPPMPSPVERTIAAVRDAYWAKVEAMRGTEVARTVWDGTFIAHYEPFCSLRCCEAFAKAAHRAGYRRTGVA